MDRIAKRIAAWMKRRGGLTDEQEEVAAYTITYFSLGLAGTFGVLFFSYLMGVLVPGILCALAAASLRLMSGGAHYGSPGRCMFMSSITFPVLTKVAVGLPAWAHSFFVITLLVFIMAAVRLYAPVDSEARPIRQSNKARFRSLSTFIVVLWAVELVWLRTPDVQISVAVGLAWQALSLMPTGLRMYKWVDKQLMAKES